MSNIRVLYFGVPSIDHVCRLSDDTKHLRDYDNGYWLLNPDSSFVFQREDTISQLHVGKKFGVNGDRLPLRDKSTLTSRDCGLLSDIDSRVLSWDDAIKRPGAIPAYNYDRRLSGPARTSIEAMFSSQNIFGALNPIDVDFVFLAGNDSASDVYAHSIVDLNNRVSGSIQATLLRSPEWATHEAFHFQMEDGGRTLIRYQEGQRHFDSSIISQWFNEMSQHQSLYDVMVINSLKNSYLIDMVADFANNFSGKVIVAPTDNMYDNNSTATRSLVENRADVVICNMFEAALFANLPYNSSLSTRERQNIVEKLLAVTYAKTVYVSDEERPSWYAERTSDLHSSVNYFVTPRISAVNPWSAGDVWTGYILRDEISSSSDIPEKTLKNATLFASYYVSQQHSEPLTREGYQRFIATTELPSSRELRLR